MSPLVGASLKRKEDRRLLTGAGRYVDDIAPPGTAHLALVRSPHAHARLTRIDTACARRLPGVLAVLTVKNVPELGAEVPRAGQIPPIDFVHVAFPSAVTRSRTTACASTGCRSRRGACSRPFARLPPTSRAWYAERIPSRRWTMQRRISVAVAIGGMLGLLAAAPVLAHHGWSGYDASQTLDLTGVIREAGYEHPHGHVRLEVPGKTWLVVLAPPSRMERRGLTQTTLQVGATATVVGYPNKTNPEEMRAERITIDGKTVELR